MASLSFAGGWFGNLSQLGRGRRSGQAADGENRLRRLHLEPLEERTLLSVTLTSNGAATSTIVVAPQPTVTAAYAAAELQSDLKQISGATVPIVTAGQPVSGAAIDVGDSAATEALGYSNSSFSSQQYLIDYDNPSNSLVLMGNDSPEMANGGAATVYGAPSTVTGQFGNALSFSGADALTIPNSGFNDSAGSLECWINFSGTSGNNNGTILQIGGANSSTYHAIERVNGNQVMYAVYNGTSTNYVDSTSTTLTGWHYILATHSTTSGKIQLYIDGVSQGTAAYTTATSCAGQQLCVGAFVNGSATTNGLSGAIDEIRVSSSVRTGTGTAPTQAPTVDSTTTCLLHLDADAGGGGTVTTIGNAAGVTGVLGRFGTAEQFDGTGGLDVANPGFTDAVGSLECWVNFSGTGGNEQGTIMRLDSSNPYSEANIPWTYHIIERINGNGVAYLVYNGTTVNVVTSTSTTLTGWHSILATHSTTTGKMQLFIDGVSQGTAAYTTATNCEGALLSLGAFDDNGGAANGLEGSVDEVRVSSSIRNYGGSAPTAAPTADSTTTCLLHFGADSAALTAYGNPLIAAGNFNGTAVRFGGTDAVTMTSPGFNDSAGSLECWVDFSGISNDNGTILRINNTSSSSYHIIDRISGCVRYRYYNSSTGIGYSVTSSVLTAGWHSILATHSTTSGLIQLFIDGVSQGTAAYHATTCAGAKLCIGGYVSGSTVSNGFLGSIDDVRVSSSVRSYGGVAPTAPPVVDSTTTGLLLFNTNAPAVQTYGDAGASTTTVSGEFDGAQQFAGDEALSVPDCGFNDNVGSLECWVDFTGTGGNEQGTILRVEGSSPTTYHLIERINGNGVGYVVYDGTNTYAVYSTSTTLTGWHSILATHSITTGTIQLFIDGVSQGTAPYTTATTCACGKLPGDTNGDGVVNGADLNTVLSNYNQTGMGWNNGDFNGDGVVNGADLNTVLSNYNQTGFIYTNSPLYVGGYVNAASGVTNGLAGSICEVRVSTSIRNYGGTAPTTAPTADGATTCLLHLYSVGGAPLEEFVLSQLNLASVPLPGLYDAQATAYAVSDFLEEYCGVCWFNPTPSGAVYPSAPTITVSVTNAMRTLSYESRIITSMLGAPSPMTTDQYNYGSETLWGYDTTGYETYIAAAYPNESTAQITRAVQLFEARLCLAGGAADTCDHSLYFYWERFHTTHPEWFIDPTNPNSQMYYTNPAVIEQVAQDAADYYDGLENSDDLGQGSMLTDSNPFVVTPDDNANFTPADYYSGTVTSYGNPAQVTGYFGNATSFSGTAAITATSSGFSDSIGSLECWVNFSGTGNAGGTILRLDGTTGWTSYQLISRTSNGCVMYSIYNSNTGATYSVTSGVLTAGWHSILATHSTTSSTIQLFIDGVSQGTAAYYATTCANMTLCIGGQVSGSTVSNGFVGSIEEVRVSSSVRNYGGVAPIQPPAADSSTTLLLQCNASTVTMYGDPQYVVGYSYSGSYPGSALQFAGSDALTAVNPGFNDSIGSMECWVDFSGTGNAGGTILRLDGTTGWTSYQLISRTSDGRVMYSIYNSNTGATYSVTSGVLTAGWHSILATHSTTSGTIQLFIDGVSQGTAAYYATTCAGAKLCIGGQVSGSTVSNGLVGTVDEIRISSSVQNYGGAAPTAPPTVDSSTTCLLHLNGDGLPQTGTSGYFTNGANSDYVFNFVNQVAAALHAMPGHQNDPISTFAYMNWGAVPTHVTLNSSIEVQFCFASNRMPYNTAPYDHEEGYLNAWVSEAAVSGRKLGLWLYPNFPLWDSIPQITSTPFECFPGDDADTIAQQFTLFGDNFSTIYCCGWYQEVEAYVSLKLMANSSLNETTLLNNYFTEMYGTSAGPIMQSIYDLIESTYSNSANWPPGTATTTASVHTNQSIAWGWLGTADVMAQLQSLMNQAISAAGSNNTYATNVNLFNLGTWQYMLAGRNQYLTTADPPTASITSPATGTIVTGVSITASASATNGGSIADVYFYADGTLLYTDTSSPYSYTWANATPGSHVLKVVAVDNQGDATTSTAVDVTVWSNADVGAVGTVGSDSYNVGNAQFTVNGAGAGVTGTADAFRFVYQSLSGNFTITAEVNSFNGATAAAGAGVMMRQNITSAGAIEASLLFNPYSNLASFNQRTTANGSTSATTSSTTGTSYWVQLVRNGTTVQAFMSNNGTTWTQVGSNATVSMTDPVLVGLAVTSGTTSSTNQAIFSNVVISQTSGSDVVMAAAASDDAPLTQGLMVTPLSLSVPEGGTAQFTVRLDTQPASDVTVAIAKQSGGDADLIAAAASLTFTSANWNTPQPVTLSAAQDADAIDGTANFLISSTGLTDQTLTATEQDDGAGGTGTAATSYVAPTFSVVGPTAGTYQAGNAVAIQWTAGGVVSGGKISLCYDADTAFNGNEHWIEIDGVPASNSGGTYTWNTAGVAPGTYYIAGYMYDGGKTFTFSHLKQAIAVTAAAPQTFAVTGPTSGTYQAGQTVSIAWTAGNVKSGSKISLCYDGDAKWWNGNEHWIEIDGVAAANGSYSYAWDTSGVQPGTYYVGGYLWNGGKTFAFSHLAQPINIAAALTLAAPEEPVPASLPSSAVLESQSELTPIVNEAMQRLAHATGSAVLANVSVEIADLPGMLLGEDIGNKIIIDRNAAGYGWFVDPTPADDVEFSDVLGPYALAAGDGSPAAHRADLLTAVMHEMGHLLGYDHDAGDDLMNATLPLGERRFLAEGATNSPGLASDAGILDDIFASSNDDGNEKWS